jgi:hypothetical protein
MCPASDRPWSRDEARSKALEPCLFIVLRSALATNYRRNQAAMSDVSNSALRAHALSGFGIGSLSCRTAIA